MVLGLVTTLVVEVVEADILLLLAVPVPGPVLVKEVVVDIVLVVVELLVAMAVCVGAGDGGTGGQLPNEREVEGRSVLPQLSCCYAALTWSDTEVEE